MTGTISFGGIGSGIDTDSIVTALVSANSTTLDNITTKISDTQSASTAISSLSTLVSKLKTSASKLADSQKVNGYAVTSSDTDIATASILGKAAAGSYSLTVSNLATAHRSYSDAYDSSSTALGQSGSIEFKVGDTSATIDITESDTLSSIAEKINSSGLKMGASTFYDGSQYRLQIRGTATGESNAISFTETGTSLGLNDSENLFQAASDASVIIDGHTVTSSTNQITGAIPGVTLSLKAKTTSAVQIDIGASSSELQTMLEELAYNYNQVVTKVHTTAGYGSTEASVSALAGDSSLRGLTNQLSSKINTVIADAGTYQTLSSIGLTMGKDGTITVDSTKLSAAITADADSVRSLLAGNSGDGVMDLLSDYADSATKSGTGFLTTKKEMLDKRVKTYTDAQTREQTRLDAYAERLREQFTQMDTDVATYNSQLTYVNLISSS
jgi:flagellar hook-associated protein 2